MRVRGGTLLAGPAETALPLHWTIKLRTALCRLDTGFRLQKDLAASWVGLQAGSHHFLAGQVPVAGAWPGDRQAVKNLRAPHAGPDLPGYIWPGKAIAVQLDRWLAWHYLADPATVRGHFTGRLPGGHFVYSAARPSMSQSQPDRLLPPAAASSCTSLQVRRRILCTGRGYRYRRVEWRPRGWGGHYEGQNAEGFAPDYQAPCVCQRMAMVTRPWMPG